MQRGTFLTATAAAFTRLNAPRAVRDHAAALFRCPRHHGHRHARPHRPGKLTFNLPDAAGPRKKGPQEISFPAYKRCVDDFTELAAAVRREQPLTVSLDEELLVAETVLGARGMT